MTIADLIEVDEAGQKVKHVDSLEDVKDFNRDPKTKNLKPKMKIAALLWQHVKTTPGFKTYHSGLLLKD